LARKIAHSGAVVVIGLGRFGKSLADELERGGVQVLAIDNDPKRVQDVAGRWTQVLQADSTDVAALRQLGIGDFSTAVIGIGNNLEASILPAIALHTLGVADVWAKAISASQSLSVLSQVGVTHVVRPEHEMGKRVAHLVRGRIQDYFEFDDGYAVVRTRASAHHPGSDTRPGGGARDVRRHDRRRQDPGR
jgi:trk system potassium uptake protein TrkA